MFIAAFIHKGHIYEFIQEKILYCKQFQYKMLKPVFGSRKSTMHEA